MPRNKNNGDITNMHREPVYEALFLIDFGKDLRFYLYVV